MNASAARSFNSDFFFWTLAFRLKFCPMGCINSTCMRSLLNYMKHSLSHPFSHSISEKARNEASLQKFYASMMLLSWIIRDNMRLIAEKMPKLLDFDKDLVHLEVASKIQLKSLVEEMQAPSKGLEKVEQELTASENDGAISAGFQKGRSADSLSQYFGDPARCPFEQGAGSMPPPRM